MVRRPLLSILQEQKERFAFVPNHIEGVSLTRYARIFQVQPRSLWDVSCVQNASVGTERAPGLIQNLLKVQIKFYQIDEYHILR